ncbi:MAG TPA: DUF1365 domain-containing protein [Anaerolineae bacterium]|nr:DUF1365 domain-containing protein [Anaerolineae bacterium]
MDLKSSLLIGHVRHARSIPLVNHFTYPIYAMLICLDELPHLHHNLPLFSYNRPNLATIYDRDHWDQSDRSIKDNLFAYLHRRGVTPPAGDIYMLTNPRIFGYVFNPVSFFYCYHADGTLALMIAEVNNTMGERYPYLLNQDCALPPTSTGTPTKHRFGFDKIFYVSPMIPMDARYEMTLTPVADKMSVHIDEFREGEKFFEARIWGQRQPLTPANLRRVLWRYPLMPWLVTARIHWQAIKLLARGLPFLKKPATPPEY